MPETNGPKGRQRLLIDVARREGLTIRDLYLNIALTSGHRLVLGTPEEVADQLEDWFLHEGCDGYNVAPPYLPRRLRRFRHPGRAGAAKARPGAPGIRRHDPARPSRPAASGRAAHQIITKESNSMSNSDNAPLALEVSVGVPSEAEARKIGRTLVEERLAGAGQYHSRCHRLFLVGWCRYRRRPKRPCC